MNRILDLNSFEENILTLLGTQELYGLDIIKGIEAATGGKRKVSFGSLYPTLHKLEKRGFLKARWGEETPLDYGAAARRRYYTITRQGQAALNQARRIRVLLLQWRPKDLRFKSTVSTFVRRPSKIVPFPCLSSKCPNPPTSP